VFYIKVLLTSLPRRPTYFRCYMAVMPTVIESTVQRRRNQLANLCNQPRTNRYRFIYRFSRIDLTFDPSLIRSGCESMAAVQMLRMLVMTQMINIKSSADARRSNTWRCADFSDPQRRNNPHSHECRLARQNS